jgi:hypothetical protein
MNEQERATADLHSPKQVMMWSKDSGFETIGHRSIAPMTAFSNMGLL